MAVFFVSRRGVKKTCRWHVFSLRSRRLCRRSIHLSFRRTFKGTDCHVASLLAMTYFASRMRCTPQLSHRQAGGTLPILPAAPHEFRPLAFYIEKQSHFPLLFLVLFCPAGAKHNTDPTHSTQEPRGKITKKKGRSRNEKTDRIIPDGAGDGSLVTAGQRFCCGWE